MRMFSVCVLALSVGAVFFANAPWWWSAPVPFFVVGLVLSTRDRCEHLYPALLPRVAGSDGVNLPARWFCCDCGESWTAD